MDEKRVTRTNRRTFSIGAAWSAALALAVGTPGAALSRTPAAVTAGGQIVGGVVEEQFGVAVSADGTIVGSSSTIGVKVTRTIEHGVRVTTITPTG
ncbi:MAG: hypothetical protein QOE11_729 [Solirubrobacteraceae bacterium]|nr:hypothetical protein [Solirubrobacteraceae bacterium]